MCIEYRDGTFSPDLPIDDAFDKFWTEFENGLPVKSLHVGTEKELDEIRENRDLQSQIDELNEKVEGIEPIKSDLIDILTDDQIKAFQSIEAKWEWR